MCGNSSQWLYIYIYKVLHIVRYIYINMLYIYTYICVDMIYRHMYRYITIYNILHIGRVTCRTSELELIK